MTDTRQIEMLYNAMKNIDELQQLLLQHMDSYISNIIENPDKNYITDVINICGNTSETGGYLETIKSRIVYHIHNQIEFNDEIIQGIILSSNPRNKMKRHSHSDSLLSYRNSYATKKKKISLEHLTKKDLLHLLYIHPPHNENGELSTRKEINAFVENSMIDDIKVLIITINSEYMM
jgi:hypothetical protein